MNKQQHDWLVAIVAFVAACIVNVSILSFSLGKLEHRVESLESQREVIRDEWNAARLRIEKAVDKLEQSINATKSR